MIEFFVEAMISGITLGAIYALLSIGLCLVYGVSKIFNFAHGTMYTLGAYFAWLCIHEFHLNYFLTVVIVLAAMFCFGVAFERVVIHPLRRRPDWQATTIIATLGVAVLLENLIMIVFTPRNKSLPPMLRGTVALGGYVRSQHEVVIFIVGLVTILLMQLFLRKTKAGMAVRSVAQDTVGARIVGIRVDPQFSYAFGVSVALAGLAGILLGPKFHLTPSGGWPVLIKAFIIVCFGGLGSIPGTLYAAFILGITEAIVSAIIGPLWIFSFWTVLFVVILTIRPRGLLGVWG